MGKEAHQHVHVLRGILFDTDYLILCRTHCIKTEDLYNKILSVLSHI